MMLFILAAFVLFTPFGHAEERALLLFDEEERPRCHISGQYKNDFSSEKIADFVREGDLTQDLRECGREDVLYASLVLSQEGPVSDTTLVLATAVPLATALGLSTFAHRTGLAWPLRLSMGVIVGTNAMASCYGGKLYSEGPSQSNHWSAAGAIGLLSGFYATTLRYADMPKSMKSVPGHALKDQAVNLAVALLAYWSCQRISAKEDQEDEEVSGTFILYGEDGEGPDYIEP